MAAAAPAARHSPFSIKHQSGNRSPLLCACSRFNILCLHPRQQARTQCSHKFPHSLTGNFGPLPQCATGNAGVVAWYLSELLSTAGSFLNFKRMFLEACFPFVLCKMQTFMVAGQCYICCQLFADESTQGKARRALQRLHSQGAGL
jgi:hypothetical protein